MEFSIRNYTEHIKILTDETWGLRFSLDPASANQSIIQLFQESAQTHDQDNSFPHYVKSTDASNPPRPTADCLCVQSLRLPAHLCLQPRVLQALRCRRSPLRLQLQHGQQEITELSRLIQRPLVLLQQNLEQTPRLQVGDVTQLTWNRKRKSEASGFKNDQVHWKRRREERPSFTICSNKSSDFHPLSLQFRIRGTEGKLSHLSCWSTLWSICQTKRRAKESARAARWCERCDLNTQGKVTLR